MQRATPLPPIQTARVGLGRWGRNAPRSGQGRTAPCRGAWGRNSPARGVGRESPTAYPNRRTVGEGRRNRAGFLVVGCRAGAKAPRLGRDATGGRSASLAKVSIARPPCRGAVDAWRGLPRPTCYAQFFDSCIREPTQFRQVANTNVTVSTESDSTCRSMSQSFVTYPDALNSPSAETRGHSFGIVIQGAGGFAGSWRLSNYRKSQ